MERAAVAVFGTGEIGLPEIAPRRIVLEPVVERAAQQEVPRGGAVVSVSELRRALVRVPESKLRRALLRLPESIQTAERLRGLGRPRLRPQRSEVEAGDAGVPGGGEAPGHRIGYLRADGAPEAGEPGGLEPAVVVDPPQGRAHPAEGGSFQLQIEVTVRLVDAVRRARGDGDRFR